MIMKTAITGANIKKNHMDILWHEYADKTDPTPITEASLPAKASVVGRVGIMMLSCGTGAWRVRSSMNELSELMNMTCTVDIGLMSINYTCFDGEQSFSQSLCLTNTSVNTSQLNRLEKLVSGFANQEITKSCEMIHSTLDEIEKIRAEINKKTKHHNLLITNMERNRSDNTLNKIANCTEDISLITGHDALFVLEHKKDKEFIKKIPAIYTWELKNMDNMEELLKLIKERKEEANDS